MNVTEKVTETTEIVFDLGRPARRGAPAPALTVAHMNAMVSHLAEIAAPEHATLVNSGHGRYTVRFVREA